MDLTMRSHSVNTFAFSKLLYRCNTIDLHIQDLDIFKSCAKSFIYADLLPKPCELTLYRPIEEGGLGLINFKCRAKAALRPQVYPNPVPQRPISALCPGGTNPTAS